jgi:hypothetical protein
VEAALVVPRVALLVVLVQVLGALMVAAAAVKDAVIQQMVQVERYVLFGRATHAHSHPQTLAIFNQKKT